MGEIEDKESELLSGEKEEKMTRKRSEKEGLLSNKDRNMERRERKKDLQHVKVVFCRLTI